MYRPRVLGSLVLVTVLLAPYCLLAQPGDKEPDKAPPKKSDKVAATLRILLPAEARLLIDETLTKSTGPERKFKTPRVLQRGKTYQYTLKYTYPEGGSTKTRMTIVKFQPGKELLVDLRPGSKANTSSQIIYVPTDQNIVDKMLEMAKITDKDVVYDLGCGDGRILVTAAKVYGAKGVGIDIDPERIKDSLENIKNSRVDKLVEVRQGDALKVADISKATVVTLYMLPEFQEKLAPILKRELKPGTRVVAHDYGLPGWKERATVTVPGMFREHILYLYRVGEKKKKQ